MKPPRKTTHSGKEVYSMNKTCVLASALSAALLLSASVSGCSSGSSSAASGSSTAGSSTAGSSAASSSAQGGSGKVAVSFLNSKGEIATQLEAAAKEFNSSNKDGITVTVSSVSASSTVDETMMSKYASGNPSTLNMVDPSDIPTYASKSMDLSNEDWAKNINSNLVSPLKADGKLVAFPFAVEGDGLIYNKTTIEKATKKTFDPSTIKSLSDLEALYKEIQAGGVTPVQISHDDWSLASHFLAFSYVTQGGSDADYYKKLKSGNADIASNETFNGLLKLLDLNAKYNIYKSSPMSSNYSTTDPQNIATGKVAFWFNGVWVMPNVSQFLKGDHANDELGFLPLFADDKTSSSIGAAVTKVVLIDNVKSTDAQRKAANEFLNWFANDPAGQKALVTDMGIIPAFTNIALAPDNGLAKSIVSYMKAGKTLPFANLSGDYYTKVGAYLQQYLVGRMDKATLAKSIDSYFKSASWVK